MRFFTLFVASIVGSHSFSATRETDSFKDGATTYKIIAQGKPVNLVGTVGAEKIEYSVYANGRFLRATEGGGTLIGCRYGDPNAPSAKFLKRLTVEGKDLGWYVVSGGVCGNTTSGKYHLVTVNAKATADKRYNFREFLAKSEPVARKAGTRYEIWYSYQEWGRGGTSSSFMVPRRWLLDPTAAEGFDYAKLDPDFSKWPKLDYVESFQSFYTAGIVDNNPDLMIRATEKLFKVTDAEGYKYSGVPNTREEAKAFAESLRKYGGYLEMFLKMT